MITDVVTNGCSYMATYAQGKGHNDLALALQMQSDDISITGSANSRIIRSTLKHSYETKQKTLYVIGLTFISREELPICRWDDGIYPTEQDVWEGAWTNPQNQLFGKNRWKDWTDQDSKQWILFREKYESSTMVDRVENLMYQILSLIDSLTHRGHNCIIYQQADQWWLGMLPQELTRLRFLTGHKNIVGDFKWCAIREQHQAGVNYVPDEQWIDKELRHRRPFEHKWLNNYLETHIRKHELHL
jgi:hypothetical protein